MRLANKKPRGQDRMQATYYTRIKVVGHFVVWKSIYSGSNTNRTGAEALSFYNSRLLYDTGSDVVKPALGFVIQNRQTLCSMRRAMYRKRY